jgi:hypothetical protein
MASLRKQQASANRNREAQRGHYCDELRRLAGGRAQSLSQADQFASEIGRLLPNAVQAGGVSVVEAAEITGISRPTLYRMHAAARQRQDLRGLVASYEHALGLLADELDHPARPYDIATRFKTSIDEVFESLMQIYPLARDEFAALGPTAVTTLVELLPEVETPESIILKMLLLHDMSTERVAWSTQLPQTQVLGWAGLGLLRLLPRMRMPAPTTSPAVQQ